MYNHCIIIVIIAYPGFRFFSCSHQSSLPYSVISYRAENHQDLATLQGWWLFFAVGAWWFTNQKLTSQSVRWFSHEKHHTRCEKELGVRVPLKYPMIHIPMIPPCLMLTIDPPSAKLPPVSWSAQVPQPSGTRSNGCSRAPSHRPSLPGTHEPLAAGEKTREGSWFIKGSNWWCTFGIWNDQ